MGGGATPTDGTDPKLASWLKSRIDEALSEEPAPPWTHAPARGDDDPTAPDVPLVPEEPATQPSSAAWPEEEDEDPETVRLNRMPVAFIGGSVMDEHTVQDVRAPAVHWREETAAMRRRQVEQRAEELVERLDSADSRPRPAPPAPPAPPADPDTSLDRVMLGLGMAAVVAMAIALVGLAVLLAR